MSFEKLNFHREDRCHYIPSIEEVSVAELVDDITHKCNGMLEVLKYCQYELPSDTEEVIKLLNIALELGELTSLVDQCSQILVAHLDLENCLPVYGFAVENGISSLRVAAFSFVLRNFMQIYEKRAFLELSLEQLSLFLSDDRLNATTEEDVFAAVVLWIKSKKKDRARFTEELMHLVRMQTCDAKFLKQLEEHFLLWDLDCFQEKLKFTIKDVEAGLPSFQEIREQLKRRPVLE